MNRYRSHQPWRIKDMWLNRLSWSRNHIDWQQQLHNNNPRAEPFNIRIIYNNPTAEAWLEQDFTALTTSSHTPVVK